jgi:hypothetical protein
LHLLVKKVFKEKRYESSCRIIHSKEHSMVSASRKRAATAGKLTERI